MLQTIKIPTKPKKCTTRKNYCGSASCWNWNLTRLCEQPLLKIKLGWVGNLLMELELTPLELRPKLKCIREIHKVTLSLGPL
jgi:hypothetical protein